MGAPEDASRWKVYGIAGPKLAPKAAEKKGKHKAPRYYPAEDVKTPLHSRKGNHKDARVRPSITPGTILILLAGRFRGKRVVCLKPLKSGLHMVTGPYKINGVPIRRVHQSYVIATQTKIDVSSVDVSKYDDDYFVKDKKTLAKRAKRNSSWVMPPNLRLLVTRERLTRKQLTMRSCRLS